MFNSITINGKTISCSGRNITVRNNTVIVDGKVVEDGLTAGINIVVNGDVENIKCSGDVEVRGHVIGDIDCGGSCTVDGYVEGNIDAGNSVRCGDITGDVDAGNSVHCGRISGDVDAGGNVRCSN